MSHGQVSCGTGGTIKGWVANNCVGFSQFPVPYPSMAQTRHILCLRCPRSWQFSPATGSLRGHAGTLAPSPTQAAQAPAAQQGCTFHGLHGFTSLQKQISSHHLCLNKPLSFTVRLVQHVLCWPVLPHTKQRAQSLTDSSETFQSSRKLKDREHREGINLYSQIALFLLALKIPSSTVSGNWLGHPVL